MPDAPIGFDESTPPEGFHGMSPSGAVAPASVSFHPSPSAQKPRFSNHIGSYHENGTYTSAQSRAWRGSLIPACAYTSFAQSLPAWGFTWSRRANIVGSLRIAMPCTHATEPSDASATCSLPITIAIAPSDDGHVSRYRSGSHSRNDSSTVLRSMSGRWRCAFGLRNAASRSLTATRWPMWRGAPERYMYARISGAK